MAVHFGIKSVYSLLSSMCTIEGIVTKSKNLNYQSVCLVDKNVLSGALNFNIACKKEGIKPLFGLEVDIKIDDSLYPICLIAKDDEGFKNLMGLSTSVCTNDKGYIDLPLLNKYRHHNYLLLYSDNMPLSFAYDKQLDLEPYFKLQEEYFKDYLIAFTNHDINSNALRDAKLKPLLKQKGIHTLALSRINYLNEEDYEEYAVLKCIRDKKEIKDSDVLDKHRHLLSFEEFASLYEEDDLKNTDILAASCNVVLDFHTSLPKYETKNNVDSKDFLISLCKEGLKRRLKNKVDDVYKKRLNEELKVIIEMHFEDYFLIVYDYILFAKKNGILVGPGRGSAAGSLVSYCLGITDIDPIKYGLLFERFLNPERITMPDIDTDFPDNRRDLVFEYVKEKYGLNHVAHIITYNTMKAKQVLRDVARVLGVENRLVDSLCKKIPLGANTLEEAYNNSSEFRSFITQNKLAKLYETALKLEGFPRHESTHAAGVVFSRDRLSEIVPLIKVENDVYSTQYTMEHLESLGLIKMDFLALRNLSIINEIVDDIKTVEHFDINEISFEDEKTFDLIDRVFTLGIFQLESRGMQNLIRQFQPRRFEEIGMTIALFRPGPMQNIPMFIDNKNHPEKIHYLHNDLKDILEDTYGIIVYQEQILAIARKMAGFSYGKADILRKAMSKKKASELEKLQNDFIEGCVNNGYKRSLASDLYELILRFANYGFNKSHSIAYAFIAYRMAYLKANYPLFFYKALLNGVISSNSKTYEYLLECKGVGIKVKGISINDSTLNYQIKDDYILMPLNICEGVGNEVGNKIIKERENGKFVDFIDLCRRLLSVGVNKDVLVNLIDAGALDEFSYSRLTLKNNLQSSIAYVNTFAGILDETLMEKPKIVQYKEDMKLLADNEMRVLGFNFSYSPIAEIKNKYHIDTYPLSELGSASGKIVGFGKVNRTKTIRTKKGDLMAFMDVSDESGELSLVLMPKTYEQNQSIIKKDIYVYFKGTIERRGSCLVKEIEEVKNG